MIAAGGSFVFVIQSNGSFTTTFTEPNGDVDTDNGTMEVDGSIVTLTYRWGRIEWYHLAD